MTEAPSDQPGDAPDLPRIREALHQVYRDLDADVRAAGPVCDLSGRCCRFVEYDHTLFLSGPEATLLVADAPTPARELDDGATCPWQDARGACTAREARPLGCRVYFCDPSYQDRMYEITEEAIRGLRRVVEALDLPWDYAPLHRHLHRAREEGRLPRPASSVPEG